MLAPQMQTPGCNLANADSKTISSAIIAEPPAIDQALVAAIVSKLRLAKHHVHEGSAGDFLCSKYGLSKWCRGPGELHAFAVKLGVMT